MSEHPSYVVFEHILKLFKSRNLTSDVVSLPPRDRFITELNHIGYLRIDATDKNDKVYIFLLLALRSKFTEQGPQLRTLITSLATDSAGRDGRLSEITVIAPEEMMGKKNMTDIVGEMRRAKTAVYYNLFEYHVFSLDIPNVKCVPRHTIVTPSELAAFTSYDRVTLRDLKTMSASSPPVVWIGGRSGQVVRTDYDSETAGMAVDYWLLTQ
jgi:DNA-directed RNA polymerase subunit H (RpoH/RPB5)